MSRPPTSERILDATLRCIERGSIGSFSLEELAEEAGVSRATLYRQFPKGRTEIIDSAIEREVNLFWSNLARFVSGSPDLKTRLVDGIMEARRSIDDHALLQRLLDSEPSEVVPAIADTGQLVHDVLVVYLKDLLEQENADPERIDMGANYLARLLLSYVGTSGGRDLTDRNAVEKLVDDQFVAWI